MPMLLVVTMPSMPLSLELVCLMGLVLASFFGWSSGISVLRTLRKNAPRKKVSTQPQYSTGTASGYSRLSPSLEIAVETSNSSQKGNGISGKPGWVA